MRPDEILRRIYESDCDPLDGWIALTLFNTMIPAPFDTKELVCTGGKSNGESICVSLSWSGASRSSQLSPTAKGRQNKAYKPFTNSTSSCVNPTRIGPAG
jgi:hypothetical protein